MDKDGVLDYIKLNKGGEWINKSYNWAWNQAWDNRVEDWINLIK